MKIAVVGATGMVGQVMLKVLEERDFPITELIPVASEKSVGKKIKFKGAEYPIVSMEDAVAKQPAIAIFSAGGGTSLEWAPKFAEVGSFVVDNSSAWRMDPTKKLVVPEINAEVLTKDDKIIANPNCSTIQLVMVLNPLHKKYKIKRVVVSTYQSVTGTGKAAVDQLNDEIRTSVEGGEASVPKVYPYEIFKNALPHCDVFSDEGYTKEELKLMREPKKIMGDDSFNLTATAVRVPVQGGHSESVNIEFENDFDLEEVKQILANTSGVTLQDDLSQNLYPMARYSEGKDDVFVGRLRRDISQPNTLNCWIVADNLRKGAATNAVQIAEYLVKHQLV
ncbi:aspartate-semialdehyde dehydrogenase [Riemerella anatipestifer]|uniref:Aspartate-semialdehyde dehydrogenase n=2 Tax=Riemerella anatipestifer TaxID=34085 RepID=E4TA73_RIEAD|nr:aspartate-semialdehyde dehydrogenase [Riemerella anatipestifer]ADQ82233.1 aspartate-semialdehyde dehydrogenase [Riemerella anatipestifer ATCC 11845 = DSM 15868]ADZ12264.1 Aspartate-semialdehyde dehydrogenase [Riemerella anatipestifer RA-GD]AFD56235.1 aspartate-semialdehyde dehydrogenase [Riemerella anatipestifer ATCC 11845 = DSM 15868]AGC39844.1 Aspartate-semialdehyde dehydrogenase [Riemerella anatipestifer RA-CH-2]AKP69439.1 aspartate-semialdehyde dehydrogenase [Riemerella anatipestifer]